MRLTTILILVTALHVSARSDAQKINLQDPAIRLEKALSVIQKQSGYSFFWDQQLISKTPPISVNIKNGTLTDALNACLSGQPFTYKIKDKFVYIEPKPFKTLASIIAKSLDAGSMLNISIRGKVVDESGKPIAGATVRVLDVDKGAITNADGEFTIDLPNNGFTIIVSSVGYESKETKTDGTHFITIVLKQKVNELDNAVVIGYGSTKKKDLTGSVSVINPKDIQDVPFLSVDNALAGKAAGVQVTKTDGTPGGAVRIRVRGSTSILGGNDPLYVIDGVPIQVKSNFINPGFDVSSPVGNDVTGYGGVSAGMSTAFVNGLNSIGGLNINDIASITILKDAASTAIYGSKAANGVVIITTKKGKKDMKPQIIFSYSGTYTKPITPKLLNKAQYKMLLTEAAVNDSVYNHLMGYPIPAEEYAIIHSPDTYFGKANTNWIDQVTRNTYSNDAEVSVRGGGSASTYYSSISYNTTPGVIKNSNYQRIAGKLNLENEIGKHLSFITNLDMGYTSQNITDGAYQQALRARPDYAPYDSTGAYTDFSKVGLSYFGYQNPVAMLSAINDAKTFSMLGSLTGIYEFSPKLKFKSSVSLNRQDYSQRNYTPSYLSIGSFYGNVENNGGIGSNTNSHITNWIVENTLTYNNIFNEKHSLDLLGGTSYETNKYSFFSATASGYPNDNVLNSLSSAVTPLFTKGDNPSKPQSYLVSYYLRANYGYMDKYLFTFTGRADGSSKFGPENKFGLFPSGAIGWRISKENFLKNVYWIDDIKFRASYGSTGTQNIGDQMYRTLYAPYAYAGSSALLPTQLGNPAIRWETTNETDAGVDFSFFKNRLQGTFDYYKKQTNNALLSLPLTPSSSYPSLLGNVASLRNSGYEFSLQGDIIRTKDFRWNASLNITWAKSLVTKLSASADLSQIGDLTGLEDGNTALIEGKPLGLITGIKVTGIIKTQAQLDAYKKELGGYADPSSGFSPFGGVSLGDPMYALNVNDGYGRYPLFNQIIGSGAPKYYGGFTQGFTYKNFELNFYFTYSEGGELMWGDGVSSINFQNTANKNAIALNRYTPENTNTNQPRLVLYDQSLLYNTSLSVYNSSYIKLRTLTINYHFPESKWMKKAGVNTAGIFCSASNLFTITSYPGNDPETSDDSYSVAGGYFDVSNYPTVKTFTLGLKIGF